MSVVLNIVSLELVVAKEVFSPASRCSGKTKDEEFGSSSLPVGAWW